MDPEGSFPKKNRNGRDDSEADTAIAADWDLQGPYFLSGPPFGCRLAGARQELGGGAENWIPAFHATFRGC